MCRCQSSEVVLLGLLYTLELPTFLEVRTEQCVAACCARLLEQCTRALKLSSLLIYVVLQPRLFYFCAVNSECFQRRKKKAKKQNHTGIDWPVVQNVMFLVVSISHLITVTSEPCSYLIDDHSSMRLYMLIYRVHLHLPLG